MLEIDVAAASYRDQTGDRVEVVRRDATAVIVIADGVGGLAGGGRAADGVVERVRAACREQDDWSSPYLWSGVLEELDETLLDDPEAGETAAVIAAVTAAGIIGASVGEAMACLAGPDGVEELTARQHPKPYLGSGSAFPIPFQARGRAGTLVVASDGLAKYIEEATLDLIIRGAPPAAAARRLIDAARLRLGHLPDDVTVVVCRVPAVPNAAG